MRRLLLVAVLLVVVGCGSAAAAPAEPTDLVGWWRVAGTDQRVLLSAAGVEVLDGCASFTGNWRADADGRFVAVVDVSQPCPDGAETSDPAWLAGGGAFTVDGADRLILDRSGAELVRLVPEPPFAGSGLVDPGAAGAAEPAQPARPVPAGLQPADATAVTGRWATGPATVEFDPGGAWSGSDGCNGAGGSWATGADGGFVAVATSVRTLRACDAEVVDVGALLSSAHRVALDGDTLVLLDPAGTETARFTRD